MTESTVTLDEALKLLELPRELGAHPESEQPIVAGLGRFGPYVKHGDDYRSLEADDDLFTVDLERALALLAAPKRSAPAAGGQARHPADRGDRRRRGAAGARRALRPVRHRRRDERVDPERHRSGDAVARRRARAARGAARRAAAAAAAAGARRRAPAARAQPRAPATTAAAKPAPAQGRASRRRSAKPKAATRKPPSARRAS